MMNSVEYCKMLFKKIVEKIQLMIVHDNSNVHSLTQDFLKKEKLKSLLLPGDSPDLNPIEHGFGLLKRILRNSPQGP